MERSGVAEILERTFLIGTSLLILSTLACDRVDASNIRPQSARAASDIESDTETASETRRSSRDPNMESIGPEGAQRIYYQFVDDSRQVQFVERLSDVPTAWLGQVGFVEMSQPPPLTPMAARRSWQVSSDRAAQILASNGTQTFATGPGRRQRDEVILYFASWCGYCKKAQAHLDREGVDYELRNVDNDSVSRELQEKTGRGGIPVLDFSGEILRGYSPDRYDEAIRSIRG